MGKKEGAAEGRTLSVRDCNERGSSVLSPTLCPTLSRHVQAPAKLSSTQIFALISKIGHVWME